MTLPPIESQITFLYTRDLAATTHFYGTALGLPLVLDQGRCRIWRVTGEAYVGFCERDDAPDPTAVEGATPSVIFTIVTPEVDAWARRLEQHGAAFEKRPAENPEYNIYHCFVRDPSGYLVEVQRFLDPAWSR